MRHARRLALAVLLAVPLVVAIHCSQTQPSNPVPATSPRPTTAAATGPTVRLTVNVTDLRNGNGDLLVGVYTTADGFPSDPVKSVGWKVLQANGNRVATFDLPPGSYAAGVLHDENRNAKMDTGLFGIPKEGYGVTNNPKPHRRAARFDEAIFPLSPVGATVTVSLQYDFL